RRPRDLVLDLGLGDWRTEIVLCLDRRRHLLAQHHRLGGSIDAHLELGLLVLLDPERTAAAIPAAMCDTNLVNSKGRVRRQLKRPIETAEGVGLEAPGQYLLALRVLNLNREGLVG